LRPGGAAATTLYDGPVAEGTAEIEVTRVRVDESARATDCVAIEAPLEIRIGDRPFAVIMRTPGRDRPLHRRGRDSPG
jgi:formate dehydrogenase assembly factor FdhD